MNNPYPYLKVERFALRETLTRPFISIRSLAAILTVVTILCPLAGAAVILLPLRFMRDNLDYRRGPALLALAGVILTVASIATGTIPIVSLFTHLSPYLYGSPNWGMLALIWLVGSVWYSAPVLIVGALVARGRAAAMDMSKEKFLQAPNPRARTLVRRKRAAAAELAAADITDATK